VNRLSERAPEALDLVPVDPERHALESRIEHAKGRIVEDLNRAGRLLRETAARTGRGVGKLVVISGIAVAGALLLLALRLRGRRIRITWK
jgi:hypothetical protein